MPRSSVKQHHIIDSFVADFRAPVGDMVDVVVYGDTSLDHASIKGIKSIRPVKKVKKSVNQMHKNVVENRMSFRLLIWALSVI